MKKKLNDYIATLTSKPGSVVKGWIVTTFILVIIQCGSTWEYRSDSVNYNYAGSYGWELVCHIDYVGDVMKRKLFFGIPTLGISRLIILAMSIFSAFIFLLKRFPGVAERNKR